MGAWRGRGSWRWRWGPERGGLGYSGKELGLFLWTIRQCPDGTWQGLSGGGGEQVGEGSVDRETGQEAIVVGRRSSTGWEPRKKAGPKRSSCVR